MSGEHEHPEFVPQQELVDGYYTKPQTVALIAQAIAGLTDVYAPLDHTHDTPPDPQPSFPGQPPTGMFLVGATTKYHEDPTSKYETPIGVALSTYRSYATPAQWASDQNLRNIVTRDVEAGRIPMPSWKPPNNRTWREIANGAEDAVIDSKLNFLKGFAPHPVHAIFHHEPDNTNNDGKGTPADYIAMNAHIRDRMEALGVINVSLNLNIIGYMFNSAAARSAPPHPRYMDNWWDADVFDFASFDPYGTDLDDPVFGRIEDWCEANSAPWMIVEWGYKAGWHGATRDWTKADVLAFHQRLRDNPLCFGAQVWDSDQNGHDYFVTPGQLAAIHELMKRSDTYRA